MIKLDLINEVVTKTGVTKTKAEMAVETVFESMKKALAKGDRIELRGFRRLHRPPAQDRHWAQPAHRRRGQHSSRKSRPLQARQRAAVDRVVESSACRPLKQRWPHALLCQVDASCEYTTK